VTSSRHRLGAWLLAAALGASCAVPSAADEPSSTLRVCADPDNLPFSSEGAGERGLLVELAELIAARLGARTEYTWWRTLYGKRAVRNTLLAGRCDAFFGLPHEGDFMPQVALSRPFLDVGWTVVTPTETMFARLDDLRGRRVAVVFGSPLQMLLASRGGFDTLTFRDDHEALDALARRAADAAFVWGPTAGYVNARKLGGRYRITPMAGEGLQWKMAIGLRKDSDELRRRLDRALADLAPDIQRLAARYGFPTAAPVDLLAAEGPATSSGAVAMIDVPRPSVGGGDAAAVAAGRNAFNQHCSHCHSPDAISPEPSRDLRRLRARYGPTTPAVFQVTVLAGRPEKGMPRFNDTLTPDTIRTVWTFLESIQD
jgi:polar amino acid transport system substrate-binding protein